MKKGIDGYDKFFMVDLIQAITSAFSETIAYIWSRWTKQQLPLAIALILCFHLIINPRVYAATSITLNQNSPWAFGILGAVIAGLVIYLFVVIFQPERF
ncbi:K(+)-transporting ATPase subunit F [Anabaena sp. FACHB-709]|uniref:Potassium-dependent ATPase G chain n=2 Tax=Nostocaceae TaxID=1162 RepID=A0A1Z4KLM3_ANAVA|nr:MULTISPECIES: K(+)-transporting ATPase subunit F [Nostocaceae]BAY69865.1 potassium-dependent ATPase G chain [Trichormus variabilis NIES-23]HBW33191.1 K(+)-transporting ATPase subunit F [Nostoc sp. UBA8866]MBD2172766.1 K(+)-transporting ATPase subunit F [Anabaena cylindrica FACHB-318]MBD2264609.1 K(+)-transporting ATPase subunit F [Anabaena sp. FACHB-709]MBD2273695.1 K(+)-transporting ATPase subunit F [Nostoc sp. PCC 7120 = FACHB-418]